MTNLAFYLVDLDGCIDEYDTLESAERVAKEELDRALGDRWHENTDRIEYGILLPIARAHEIDRRNEPEDADEANRWEALGWQYVCDHKLKPTGTTDAAMRIVELERQLAESRAEVERLRRAFDGERALVNKMSVEFAEARVGLLNDDALLVEALDRIIGYFEHETSQGDGISEEHFDGYEAAKSTLRHAKTRSDPYEDALFEVSELQRTASIVPGMSAELDSAKAEVERLRGAMRDTADAIGMEAVSSAREECSASNDEYRARMGGRSEAFSEAEGRIIAALETKP